MSSKPKTVQNRPNWTVFLFKEGYMEDQLGNAIAILINAIITIINFIRRKK